MSGTPVVLVVGGVDPTGGAGLSQDVAYLSRLGVRAAPVVSALAIQDDRRVRRVEPVPPPLFVEQLSAACEALARSIAAIKTGLVAHPRHADAVAEAARSLGVPLVVDPILAAGTGERLHPGDPRPIADRLLGAAALITPNASEAAALSGVAWDGGRASLMALARALATPRRCAAVSGGEAGGDTVPLAVAGTGVERLVECPRAARGATHGTGCALASAAAGYVALGLPPADAAAAAHRLVGAAMAASRGVEGLRLSPQAWSV